MGSETTVASWDGNCRSKLCRLCKNRKTSSGLHAVAGYAAGESILGMMTRCTKDEAFRFERSSDMKFGKTDWDPSLAVSRVGYVRSRPRTQSAPSLFERSNE